MVLYFRHRYECQYGPKDLSDKVLTITPEMETKKPKYNVKGKLIPNGRGKGRPRIGAAATGMSIKRGCVCRFQVKQLYYLRDVVEIVYYNPRHENPASLVVHGAVLPGERGRFEKQIPAELRNWVLSSLRSGVSSNKILSTHRAEVMRLVAEGVPPERCHFLREWDVRNIAKELRKTEYQRDDNDAESVKMWVEANPDDVFFYRLVKKGTVSGTLTSANLPFVIGIQNEFQFKMMLQHGHESIVSMDATFGTNHWKVRPIYFDFVSFSIHFVFRDIGICLAPAVSPVHSDGVRQVAEWSPCCFHYRAIRKRERHHSLAHRNQAEASFEDARVATECIHCR